MKSTVLATYKALNTPSVSVSVTIEIHCDAWKWRPKRHNVFQWWSWRFRCCWRSVCLRLKLNTMHWNWITFSLKLIYTLKILLSRLRIGMGIFLPLFYMQWSLQDSAYNVQVSLESRWIKNWPLAFLVETLTGVTHLVVARRSVMSTY